VATFFEQEKPEFVILAAAKVGGIVANSTYRGQFIYENLMIQNNVIHNAYLYGVKKLLFLGSTCIYPRDAPQPMPEDCLLTSPLEYTNEPYAIAKIAGIKMCESYNLQYGTNFISVMPTNLYGPNDNFNLETSHVLPALIRKIHLGKCLEEGNWEAIYKDLKKRPIEELSGEVENRRIGEEKILELLVKYGIRVSPSPDCHIAHSPNLPISHPQKVAVEIWGTGTPLREFLWSEEMADACVYCLENVDFKDVIYSLPNRPITQSPNPSNPFGSAQSAFPEIRNTHINIGTGKEITIKELAFLIKSKIGFNGEIVFNTSKPDGTMRKLTDPSKIHSLGWHHKIEVEEGVERLYKWYQKDN